MLPAGIDTIAAIATPPGPGGVGIIRVSGPLVPALFTPLLGNPIKAREAAYRPFLEAAGAPLDRGIALYFKAPHSFTGEDILELQTHGSPVILDLLLRRLVALGCRLARPGEFSERAFLNGKIDLTQAEAIADLINSTSESAARSAQRSLQGAFSGAIHRCVEALITLRQYVEAAIDFTDEDINFIEQGDIYDRLLTLKADLRALIRSAQDGVVLQEGASLVLIGRPNTGKSSLLNCLSGRDAAIVTPIAGTTRDSLRERIHLEGLPLHLIDTAGIRDHTDDPVEREGIIRARREMETADLILLMVDDEDPGDLGALVASLSGHRSVLTVRNKIDLTGKVPARVATSQGIEVLISLKTGEGLDVLRETLKEMLGYQGVSASTFTARRRHVEAMTKAEEILTRALGHVENAALELVAEELKAAQQALDEITGRFTSDDLLGRIFSNFCIGK